MFLVFRLEMIETQRLCDNFGYARCVGAFMLSTEEVHVSSFKLAVVLAASVERTQLGASKTIPHTLPALGTVAVHGLTSVRLAVLAISCARLAIPFWARML